MNSLIKQVFALLLFSSTVFFTGGDINAEPSENNPIYLYDIGQQNDMEKQTVAFPSYLRTLSKTFEDAFDDCEKQNEEIKIAIPASTDTLEALRKHVIVLSECAKDTHGQPVAEKNIQRDTLYPFIQVKEKSKAAFSTEAPLMAMHLYRLSNYLDIEPLYNVFASFIADGIYSDVIQLVSEIPTRKESKGISTEALHILAIQEGLVKKEYIQKQDVEELGDELILKISKHIEYQRSGVTENTVQDLIALHGQPTVEEITRNNMKGKKLDLSKRRITSLEGLSLIENSNEVIEIILDENCILGMDRNIDFPTAPFQCFPHLLNLSLERCHITKLSKHPFRGVRHLQWVSLKGNKLHEISCQLEGVTQLKWLYLNENKIKDIAPNAFQDNTQLKLLYLDHNQLKELPEGIFNGLNTLRSVSVHDNGLQGTKAEFKQRYLGDRNPVLYYSQMDLLK